MQLKLTGLYGEPRWFVMASSTDDKTGKPIEAPDDPAFRIRPYPAGREQYVLRAGGELAIAGERLWDKFCWCLVDWRNVVDAAGAPVPCNEITKRNMFDYRIGGVPSFVNECLARIEAERERDEKN
jgi:hypothetical protein